MSGGSSRKRRAPSTRSVSFASARSLSLRRALAVTRARRQVGLGSSGGQLLDEAVDVDARVQTIQVALGRERPHRLAYSRRRRAHDRARRERGRIPSVAAGDLQARRQPLERPTPTAPVGLVEVVEVEDQAAVRAA